MLALPGTRSGARVPALCFEPVFKPHKQDLCFYKGADFNFSLLVADYPIDFRGASFAMEIRPPDGDVRQIKNVLGSTAVNASVIKLEFEKLDCSGECKTDRDIKKLESLPINEGDFVTLEGSGVTMFPILSVTANSILVEGTATRDVSKARVFFRYKSWASFNVFPSFIPFNVVVESPATIGSNSITIQPLTRKIDKGEKIVFESGSDVVVVTLAEDAPFFTQTINIVEPLTVELARGVIAVIDAFAVIVLDTSLIGTTALSVSPTKSAIPANTILKFSQRTIKGWEYLGEATVISTAPKGSETIEISPLEQNFPVGAIAHFGSIAFNTLTVGITADDTRGLHLKKYSYDLIVRLDDGEKIPIMKGDINFDGYVSDFV
jgi:hypothetical protein